MHSRTIVLSMLAMLAAAPGLAQAPAVPPTPPSDPAALAEARTIGATAKQLESALLAYYDANHAWPANIGALVAFAKANGHTINIGVFGAINLQVAGDAALVTFEGGPAYPSQGAFAVTRRTIR